MYDTRTALIEVEPGRAGRRRAWLRKGKAGNVETLFEMRRIIRESVGLDGARENTQLAALADFVLDAWNVRTGSEYEINRAVFEWIAENISYTQDRAGGYERLQYPLETVRRGRGDCDDLEILASALLALCGIQSLWLEAAKYSEETDGEDHVYGFARVLPEYSLDSTGIIYHDLTGAITEGRALGWHETQNLEWIRVPVFEDPRNVMFSGFWSTLAAIGGAVAAPFTAGASLGVTAAVAGGVTAAQVGAAALDARHASAAQQKQIGQAFEALAKETVDLFYAIQTKPVITADDYNAAAAKLSSLAAFAEQYPTDYVTTQWNDKNYKPAFEQTLQKIYARATSPAATGAAATTTGAQADGTVTTTTNSLTAAISGDNLLPVVGILAAVFVGLKLFRG